MADIIARFKGDTSDLDGKVGKASKTLMQMKADCEKVGGAFINLEKDELELIKSLGKLETGSKTAKGTVAELTKAFTDMSAVYNRLSEEEKKDEGGKALRASLDQLKARIKDGQTELNGISAELGTNGNMLEQLSGKFGVNIKALGTWGMALGAGKVALNTLKDAFFSSEKNVDDWGRTVEASKGLYESFVTSLNNMSLDGFFANIQEVIDKAKEAYNAIDDLATKGGKISNKEARLNYQKQQQMAIINDKSATDAQRKAAQDRLKELNRQTKDAKKATADLNNEVIRSKIKQKLAGAGFKEGTAQFNEAYKRAVRSLYDENYQMGTVNTDPRKIDTGLRINSGKGSKKVERVAGSNVNLDNLFTDKWREEVNPYIQAYWNTLSQSEADTRLANRFSQKAITSGGSSSSGSGKGAIPEAPAGSIAYFQKLAQDAQKQINEATTDGARAAAKKLYDEYQSKIKQMKADADAMSKIEGVSVLDQDFSKVPMLNIDVAPAKSAIIELEEELARLSTLQELNIISPEQLNRIDELTAKLKEVHAAIPLTPAQKAEKAAEENQKAWSSAASAIQSMGSAMSQIDDPAAKVMGTIALAIANVAGTFATSLKGTMTPWDWIAAAAAGTSAMISTIAAIKSATAGSYAQGGVIGGNSYYGDKLYARVNSGETVLNQRQARTALEMMDSGGGVRMDASNLRLTASVSGENLRFVLNNNGRRTGRGEVAYSRG